MAALRFTVPVAADDAVVRQRLAAAGDRPGELVGWFTDDPAVEARVSPAGEGWRVQVLGPTFRADARITVDPRPVGSAVAIDGDLRGRGLLGLASPALGLLGPRIEGHARHALHREFGEPATDRR